MADPMTAHQRAGLNIQNEIIRLEGEKSKLNKQLADLQSQKAAASNPDKAKSFDPQIRDINSRIIAINTQIAAKNKEYNELLVMEAAANEKKAETAPKDEQARIVWEKERAQRDKNEAAGKGWYTDAELAKLEDMAAGRSVASQNANTAATNAASNAAAVAENSRHNQVLEKLNTEAAELLRKKTEHEITHEEYTTELNKIYNDARLELDRAQTEVEAAGAILQADVTQRGQDLDQESNIRTNTTQSYTTCAGFIQNSMKYMKKGVSLSFDNVTAMCDKWNEAQRKQVLGTKSENQQPRAKVPGSLADAADVEDAGLDQVGTASRPRGGKPAEPGTAETPEEAADMLLAKFDEWATQGLANDPKFVPSMEAFLEHDAATGGEATMEDAEKSLSPRFEAPTPYVAPEAAPQTAPLPPGHPDAPPGGTPTVAAPAPGSLPSYLTPPPAATPRADAGQSQQQGQPAPGVVINNNMAPATGAPVAPPMPPPAAPKRPEEDPDFMTAVDEEMADIMAEAGFPDSMVSKYRQPQDQYGPFTQMLRSGSPMM